MSSSILHQIFAPLKRILPSRVSNFLRSLVTAIMGPVRFAFLSGFVRSSFKMSAVARDGTPLPWYTYPLIDFLRFRDFSGKKILEFGGGQSTLWWAQRAQHVTTLEGDQDWYQKIKGGMPDNVDLRHVSMASRSENEAQVRQVLQQLTQKFDIVVIDGLYREQMIDIAQQWLKSDGVIICDNSDGYGFVEGFKQSGLMRVDFYGNAPGVVLPSCSSIYFSNDSDLFSASYNIQSIHQNR